MIPIKQRLLKPLKYPEFTVPGFLCLMIGSILAAAAWIIGGPLDLPIISGLLIVTGAALMLRTELGTLLLILVLAFGIHDAAGRIDFSWSNLYRHVLGLVFLASIMLSLVEQIDFHRFRRKNPRFSKI